uniref:EOG090X0719 n=1 Tax=Daphnia dolichocephala TaxID=2282166 RepID=A0A4Y7M5R5_9CRUS|nr:EOG090X0719 [Daphnia dolichocephala]
MLTIAIGPNAIRRLLLLRGLEAVLKTSSVKLKTSQHKGGRPDKIVEQFVHFITLYDLNGLKDYWNHFDQSVFERLDQNFMPAIKKMENSLLRMYLINACINGKQEKVQEFFEKLGSELQHQLEWKDWFALPFIKNPEENPAYMVYFTRQWQDTMLISLHNLLAVSFQCLPQPKLTTYNEEAGRVTRLQAENDQLKSKLARSNVCDTHEPGSCNILSSDNLPPGLDLIDEFYLIPVDTSPADNHSRSFRSFIRGFGTNNSGISGSLNTSPLSGRRASSSPMNRF